MRPKVKLSRLRDIGWSLWDPIGLLDQNENWNHQPFADEYDTYLMQAAGQLRRNASVNEVVDYLIQIETDHMGLGAGRDEKQRAATVVEAILADKELWTIPDK